MQKNLSYAIYNTVVLGLCTGFWFMAHKTRRQAEKAYEEAKNDYKEVDNMLARCKEARNEALMYYIQARASEERAATTQEATKRVSEVFLEAINREEES